MTSGGAAVWAGAGRGYSAAEMRAKAADGTLTGVSKWDLDTPALCVDLDRFEQNIATLRSRLTPMGVASRPHGKSHKCPAIAKLQLAAGSIGICAAKLGEAEVFAANGIEPILMTTSNVSPNKIRRAMALRKTNPRFIQAVDYPQNAHDLNDAAKEAGIVADVVVDVAIGTRSGVPAGAQALALGQLVDTLPNLKLRGIISYDGSAQHIKGFKNRLDQTLNASNRRSARSNSSPISGLSTEIFSGGGTGTYNILPKASSHVTDVQVGSYIFMDCQYLEIGGESNDELYADFASSLTVLTTVLNTYFREVDHHRRRRKGADAEQARTLGDWREGLRLQRRLGRIRRDQVREAEKSYKVGDKLELIAPHCDPVVNEYDQMYAIRKDRVEAVWPILAARTVSQ